MAYDMIRYGMIQYDTRWDMPVHDTLQYHTRRVVVYNKTTRDLKPISLIALEFALHCVNCCSKVSLCAV